MRGTEMEYIPKLLAEHDRRVAELLEANNREVYARRDLQRQLDTALLVIETLTIQKETAEHLLNLFNTFYRTNDGVTGFQILSFKP